MAATSVAQYLKGLPADRREALEAVRAVINKNLDKKYEEGIQYGMIGWYVPHSVYPAGYHCDPKQPLPFAGLASQKNHMSVYLMCLYGHDTNIDWFVDEWKKTGKKLDMGKACIRFKKLDDLALNLIGKAVKKVPVKKFIDHYENAIQSNTAKARAKSAKKKAAKKKAVKKK